MILAVIVDVGVTTEDVVKGDSVVGVGATRRAGFGKVLNVDPRDVYLRWEDTMNWRTRV